MITTRQEELTNRFLLALDEEARPVYREIAAHLAKCGYHPQKQGSNLSFKTNLHGKQIAKMGIRKNKEHSPFFSLRFSACSDYGQRFTDIVREAIAKYPQRVALCKSNRCGYCGGKPDTHVYTYTFPDGESKSVCGAYSLEIPNIAADDIAEVKRLIDEEHAYLLKHEVDGKKP